MAGSVLSVFSRIPSEVLRKLGVLRNELLIFAILAAVIINVFALMLQGGAVWKEICAVIMHFTAVLILVGFGSFYAFAVYNLPGTGQELEFARSAEQTLDEHQRRRRRSKRVNES